jgi:hypothetical protein
MTAIDAVLRDHDWTFVNASDESWRDRAARYPQQLTLRAQERALGLQEQAATDLAGLATEANVLQAQDRAITAQSEAIAMHRSALFTDGRFPDVRAGSVDELGVQEARLILDQVYPEDSALAWATFQYPILHRPTRTWGTVHYEPGTLHSEVRLRNSRSEPLKVATEALVENLESASARSALGALRFQTIRVLEPQSGIEAFLGEVLSGRTLRSVLHEKRRELQVALVFLALALILMLVVSPLLMSVDYKLHAEKIWKNGWLAWWGGNLSRVGSALFVGVFLPVVQVILFWLERRRRAAIRWDLSD